MAEYQEAQHRPGSRTIECPVSVYTEWEPLEEVIVGTIEEARVPDWHMSIESVVTEEKANFFRCNSGQLFDTTLVAKARDELEYFASVLRSEGITVRRPIASAPSGPYVTPYFKSSGNMYSAMPRDCLLVIGDLIIEAPMSWRNRYFETFPFRSLIMDYFRRGARWISAPKPQLSDKTYLSTLSPQTAYFQPRITEEEPLFDAADFMKFGTKLIGQISHVTNWSGVEWLRRALGSIATIEIYEFDEPAPMHIDTTIIPLGPRKVMVNPEWVKRLPNAFKGWDILVPPPSSMKSDVSLYFSSPWISLNVLVLDERRVIVESHEAPLIEALAKWGFEPIAIPFRHFQQLGGGFHCATLDIRRRRIGS